MAFLRKPHLLCYINYKAISRHRYIYKQLPPGLFARQNLTFLCRERKDLLFFV